MTPWERPFKDTRTPLSSLALAFNACLLDATFELLQRLRRRFGKNRMEKGIGAKRAGQILLGFVLRVDVAQGGCVVRHRQDSDRLLVEIDRFVVSFLRPAQLRQTG